MLHVKEKTKTGLFSRLYGEKRAFLCPVFFAGGAFCKPETFIIACVATLRIQGFYERRNQPCTGGKMKPFTAIFLAAALAFGSVVPVSAHFMVVYTPEIALGKIEGDTEMRIVFTHPAEAGHVMSIDSVQEFYAVHQRGESDPKSIDMKSLLQEVVWKNPESSGSAFAASIPRKELRNAGDYSFVVTPGYYYEKDEDIYIQQIAKLIINVGGMPGNWNEPLGLPCEIVPLIKPYALWTGNVFRAQVLSKGKPVPGAEVEIEYMNHMPDINSNSMSAKSTVTYPHSAFVAQTIIADDQGYIVFGIPRAGWWGFAALGVGPDTEYKGKKLSQDAVIWVKAVDMK